MGRDGTESIGYRHRRWPVPAPGDGITTANDASRTCCVETGRDDRTLARPLQQSRPRGNDIHQSLTGGIHTITMRNCRLFRFCELANIGGPVAAMSRHCWRDSSGPPPNPGGSLRTAGTESRGTAAEKWRRSARHPRMPQRLTRLRPPPTTINQVRETCCHANIKRVEDSMTMV